MKSIRKTPTYSRLHDRPVENLIAAAHELLALSVRSGDGDAVSPAERQRVHQLVEGAVAALRAPTVPASALLMTKDDGRRMAFDLIRRLERLGGDEANCYLYNAYIVDQKEGVIVWRSLPQVDIVGVYLERVRGSAGALAGFTSVLTDYLATCSGQGGSPVSDEYAEPPRELPTDKRVPA